MKKNILLRLAFALILTAGIGFQLHAAPSRDRGSSSVLTVGATAVPHAELLNLIREDLAAEGISLVVREFSDYVMPNTALLSGDLDANFFQHRPYLESNAAWSNLSPAFGVHVEPLGLYSRSITSKDGIANGARIAIPNDPTNGGRALLLLQYQGLITLSEGSGLSPTVLNITGNPKNLVFVELEAAMLPRSLDDVDAAVINGNFALSANLSPANDAIFLENQDSPYVNYVVVRNGMENDPRITALSKALRSAKVKNYINQRWNGSVIAAF